MKKSDLLVIVIAYNSMKWAKRCYDSLYNSTYPCDIITIDNGSSDGTQELIQRNYSNVELMETGQNLGFGKANNIGLQKALDEGYQYVYLLNQDAWIMPDTFEKIIAISKKNTQYGILSPMQLDGTANAIDKGFLSNIICAENLRHEFINDYYFGRHKNIYNTQDVPAAHWLITRECIMKVGGFSPTFPHYGEDNNYTQRVCFHGFKIGIVTNTFAIHDRGGRKATASKERDMYDTYIKLLIQSSNPFTPQYNRTIHYGIVFLLRCIKHIDYLYWVYAQKLLTESNKINQNTKESIKGFAFLRKPQHED